jgi:hypothetical protein
VGRTKQSEGFFQIEENLMLDKFKAFITLFASLFLAGVAGIFAVSGLTIILSGSFWGAVAMGSAIELGKLTGVSWLYSNWKTAGWIKYGILPMTMAAMLATSIGIFGYLAKANGVQSAPMDNARAQVELIDQKIQRNQEIIDRNELLLDRLDKELTVMDGEIAVLVEYNKINRDQGSRATRASQQQSRDRIERQQDDAYDKIDKATNAIGELRLQRIEDSQIIRDVEVEMSGVSALATLFNYDNQDRLIYFFFALLIFTFDPLAIFLLMAANRSLTEIYGTAIAENQIEEKVGLIGESPVQQQIDKIKPIQRKDPPKEEPKKAEESKPQIKAKQLNPVNQTRQNKGWANDYS